MASCSHRGLQQLRQLWNIVAMHRTTTNVAVTRPPDRILPVAVPQSGLAPPCTQRRLGSGRLKMYVYANLNGLELPDRAQRRCEDQRICRWRGPPSRSSQPVALGSSVPWSFPLSLSLDLRAALPKWNYHGHGNLPSGHRRTDQYSGNAQDYNGPRWEMAASHRFAQSISRSRRTAGAFGFSNLIVFAIRWEKM